VLSSNIQNVPERQQTLRGTIDWSYGLLDAAEQTMFRRVAVFAGGCTLDAAEAVCGDSVLESFASLADKSLLERRDSTGGEPRFAMLETVREYALERLEQSDDAERPRGARACVRALARTSRARADRTAPGGVVRTAGRRA
jgi:predicted ATPase